MNANFGYDPRPDIERWRGTPIPPVSNPLARTPDRWRIAEWVWWNGPPWTVLRNASYFLWHVMDYATDADRHLMMADVPPEVWLRALEDARPGQLSKGAYCLFSRLLDRMGPAEICDWPDDAHLRDIRPLAGETRERRLERHLRRSSPRPANDQQRGRGER